MDIHVFKIAKRLAMTKNVKTDFEKKLKAYLADRFAEQKDIKVLKNEILIEAENGQGRIRFRYLRNLQGYSLSESVSMPAIQDFFEKTSPPYKPHFGTDFVLVMNTSMESKYKQFSPTGTVSLPRDEEELDEVCDYFYQKIKDIYLPRIRNLLQENKQVIEDVLRFPNYYKYPFLTILYIIEKNELKLERKEWDAILSRRIMGNKKFDQLLLERYSLSSLSS
ncbi:MAG: hypothetical protein HXM17_04880 [Fusobacterium periodonticum]|jgi:hypothetical protein|nr:hypothetical protein [Fusobacterium periodonticum]